MRNFLAGLVVMVGASSPQEQSGELADLAAQTLDASGAPAVGVMRLEDGEPAIGVAGSRAFRGDAPVGEDTRTTLGDTLEQEGDEGVEQTADA